MKKSELGTDNYDEKGLEPMEFFYCDHVHPGHDKLDCEGVSEVMGAEMPFMAGLWIPSINKCMPCRLSGLC